MNKTTVALSMILAAFLTGCQDSLPTTKSDPVNTGDEKTVGFLYSQILIDKNSEAQITLKSNTVLTTEDTVEISIAGTNLSHNKDFKLASEPVNGRILVVGQNSKQLRFPIQVLAGAKSTKDMSLQIKRVSGNGRAGDKNNLEVEIPGVPTLRDNLIAEYLFNGNANDSGPLGLHGTVEGATLTYDRDSVPNKAYAFDGYSFIEVANHDSLNFNNNFTIAAWVKASSFKTMGSRIVDKSVGSSGGGFLLDTYTPVTFGGNRIRFMAAGNGWSYLSPTDLDTDEWYFVVATYESGLGKVYINTELNVINTSGNTEMWTDSTPMRFGFDTGVRTGPDFDDSLEGLIDDVRIYHRVLAPSEIASLYSTVVPQR